MPVANLIILLLLFEKLKKKKRFLFCFSGWLLTVAYSIKVGLFSSADSNQVSVTTQLESGHVSSSAFLLFALLRLHDFILCGKSCARTEENWDHFLKVVIVPKMRRGAFSEAER